MINQTCPGLNANEIQISHGELHSVLVGKKSPTQTILSNMKQYENVLIKQYLRSILDIIVINNNHKEIFVRCFFVLSLLWLRCLASIMVNNKDGGRVQNFIIRKNVNGLVVAK